MNFLEILFFIHLFAAIGICGIKLYNLLSAGEWYDYRVIWMTTAAGILNFGVGLISYIRLHADDYTVFMYLTSALLTVMVGFTLAELILAYRVFADTSIKPYKYEKKLGVEQAR